MEKWDNRKTKDLIAILLALKSEKEAKSFLRDLMTEKEIIEFGNRWKAAQMLSEKVSYQEIQRGTGLSTKTIARISKWLKEGKGGYQTMINKLHHHDSSRKRSIMTG